MHDPGLLALRSSPGNLNRFRQSAFGQMTGGSDERNVLNERITPRPPGVERKRATAKRPGSQREKLERTPVFTAYRSESARVESHLRPAICPQTAARCPSSCCWASFLLEALLEVPLVATLDDVLADIGAFPSASITPSARTGCRLIASPSSKGASDDPARNRPCPRRRRSGTSGTRTRPRTLSQGPLPRGDALQGSARRLCRLFPRGRRSARMQGLYPRAKRTCTVQASRRSASAPRGGADHRHSLRRYRRAPRRGARQGGAADLAGS